MVRSSRYSDADFFVWRLVPLVYPLFFLSLVVVVVVVNRKFWTKRFTNKPPVRLSIAQKCKTRLCRVRHQERAWLSLGAHCLWMHFSCLSISMLLPIRFAYIFLASRLGIWLTDLFTLFPFQSNSIGVNFYSFYSYILLYRQDIA